MAKILVVKRRPDDIEWLTKLLSGKGHEVVSTQTVSLAMEILYKEKRIDLIICGKVLGDTFAEGLLKVVKQDNRFKEFRNVPVIVSSGMFDKPWDGQWLIEEGAFATFIERYDKSEELLKLVEEALSIRRGDQKMSKKILVIDDEKDLVEIYRKALSNAGYETICAYSGEEGLNILKANPFDLVVLDLKMSKMTGDEFLKIVRGDPLLKDTKVLVMSSVLYRYKEIHRYEQDGRYVRTDIVKEGFSKLGKRADKTTKPEEAKLEMEEKPKPRVKFDYQFGYEPEEEAEFERNLSEDLIRRVKGIFGEPYQEPYLRTPEILKKEKRFTTAIETRTKDLIAKYLKVEREKIYWDSTSFEKDLGIAFIDAIPLRQRLEKEFKVKLSWEDQKDIETVGELIRCIEYTKMYARTKKERFRESDRKFWEDWKPIVIFGIILPSVVGLAILIWELVIKKYFLK